MSQPPPPPLPSQQPQDAPPASPPLVRHFGTLHATALNMSNMVGIGPFITIPILMTGLMGPESILGWLVALLIVIPDGLIWSELGASMPGSGGTYRYLRDGFGSQTFGRLLAFLFIWQFIVSGPLEIASGYIGFANYLGYLWRDMGWEKYLIAVAVGVFNIILLYRKITHVGKITVILWIGTLATTFSVILAGIFTFDPKVAFNMEGVTAKSPGQFFFGLGAASCIGVYDYLGYYDICYIGDEVKNPGRTIPRSIIWSVLGVAFLYLCINLSVMGVIPWQNFVPEEQTRPFSSHVVSHFMEQVLGPKAAMVFTIMVLWTALGSCFALLLGYSRIPYAAARDGNFFRIFGKVHPEKQFPAASLLAIGGISIVCSFFPLDIVISSLVALRILIQFIGQIAAVVIIRKRRPDMPRPYKIWMYPLPVVVALCGWIFIYVTLDPKVILFSLAALAIGLAAFFAWSATNRTWPFQPRDRAP